MISLDKSFYEAEERCGYMVSAEMKKVWAVELDLLARFIEVCEKHNLHYCLGGGTLLGAVRHKGFIPWDDDIDVYMLRPDYDKLLTLADEFEAPYFLQNSYTEKYLFRTHSQLRNSETTGCIRADRNLKINKGIFIDIFPLDGVEDDTSAAKVQAKKYNKYLKILRKVNSTYSTKKRKSLRGRISTQAKKLMFTFIRKDKLAKSFEDNLKMLSKPGTVMWGNRTLVFDCPKSRRPYEEWLDLIDADFEMLKVRIPRSYDGMLTQQYGKYMEFPKNKQGGNMHGGLILDPDVPYYKNKELGGN
ncbi:MAG: phosphorylcholine transferase LicD [Candidatus Ornithomonoglobus sp.]